MATTYAIPDGRTVMAATTYTGTGATASISNAVNGVSFQPDFVWIKSRSAATSNLLYDSVRTATYYLVSNSTSTEGVGATTLTAFNSGGFQLGSDSGAAGVNVNAATYVGWQWKAGGTAVSNTAGNITSSVSANTTAGFSVVTYTGNGLTNQSVGHGLGATPGMVIIKQRSGTASWLVHHQSQPTGYTLYLNLTNAQDNGTSQWGTSAQTSSLFYVGFVTGATGSNVSASTYVAYCWAPVAGYSAFGSYTGNGSTDGPFVFCGFRPRFVMVKRTDTTGNWIIWDSARDTYNTTNLILFPNLSNAESTAENIDFLSNGFKLRVTSAGDNASGGTYIYAAFAENPLKYANAR